MEERRVRICDIAEELGLSTATVSNVLHGKTKKISDETVRRVQALLEERQYIPSMAGILLAQNSSRIIGVVINDHEKYESHTLDDVYIASSLNELSTEIDKRGQFMMVKKTTEPETIIRFASMWNLDGLVLMGFCDEDYEYLRAHMHIPFVVYDGYDVDAERIYNIAIDNYSGGYQVGEYFRKGGHKRALCISDNCVCLDKDRYEGFAEGFGRENADFLMVPMHKEKRRSYYKEKLELLKTYTAIFTVSDFYAIELLQFFQVNGLRVPEDISIAGFDDIPMCQQIMPTLTSVQQNVSLRARIAVEKIAKLRNKEEVEPGIILPVTLVVRESTCART